MNTDTDSRDTGLYQALINERFGPLKATARERAATPAELIRLPQRRRNERRAAA